MEIKRKITLTNRTVRDDKENRYIVIHYVGAVSTAYNNACYFNKTYRGASAHYFVDETSIWQVVEDKDNSWHCGASVYKHPDCRNANSIGIELCCKKRADGTWYFEDATVKNAIKLTKYLMVKYGIPVDRVIRHYDVTGKICPEPYVRDEYAWKSFKQALVKEEKEEENMMIYNKIEDCPDWSKDSIKKLIDNGYLKGEGSGLNLSYDMIRLLVIMTRMMNL